MKSNTVTCSFVMDRDVYNTYKSIIAGYGQSVKNNIIEHMQNVINYGIPNAETLAAIREVEELEKDPNKKVYNSFDELLEELDNE